MKYVHTNIITDDWKRLAQFYIQAFACKMTLPHRNLSGEWLSQATGVYQAQIKGAHLRLPGWGNQGPTLEIFQYTKNESQPHPLSNRKGLGHLAFEVENVEAALEKALAFGGECYGEIAVHQVESMGTLTFVYLRDPDGNIIELQNWGKASNSPIQEIEKKLLFEQEKNSSYPIKQEPSKQVEPLSNIQEKELDSDLDKRAFLDALQKDLDTTRQVVKNSQAEIKASKAELKSKQQLLNKELSYISDEELSIKKDKQELLQELKEEIENDDLEQRALPVSTNTPSKQEKPPVTNKLNVSQISAQLHVEVKIGDVAEQLGVTEEQLGMPTATLAHNLQLLTTVPHPTNNQLSFLEYLGKQYRADLVPLVKVLKGEQQPLEKEKAWVFLPRLKGSIHHLLEQCQQQAKVLENLGLEQLNLSPQKFIATYESLMKVANLAEQQAATNIRFCYTSTLK